jgi:hypothetical protein
MLGAAPLIAVLTGVPAARAKSGGKNGGNKKKHRPIHRPAPVRPRPLPPRPCPAPIDYCEPLAAECYAFADDYCDGWHDPEECESLMFGCCDHLQTCDTSTYFTCLANSLPTRS